MNFTTKDTIKLAVLSLVITLLGLAESRAQIRAFDNSRAFMPWLYNPAADMPAQYSAYLGYDARGNSSITPQSMVAGVRVPVIGVGRGSSGKHALGVAGLQALNTSQSLANLLTVQANYAHQISLNDKVRLGFGMGMGMQHFSYDQDELVYFDEQDPFFQQGDRLFNLNLQVGVSLVADDKLFIHLSSPDMLKNGSNNFDEIIVRSGFILPLQADFAVVPAVYFETYNHNRIYGGDLRVEWKKMLSVLAGADRYKAYGGLQFKYKEIGFGYTYGQNFSNYRGSLDSHQISLNLSASGKRGR